jgi:hypothetical protein
MFICGKCLHMAFITFPYAFYLEGSRYPFLGKGYSNVEFSNVTERCAEEVCI